MPHFAQRPRYVTRDRNSAFAWYMRAACQQNAKSIYLVGRFLEEGWECHLIRPRPLPGTAAPRKAATIAPVQFRVMFRALLRSIVGQNLDSP
jgi:TPR repeat protein